MMGDEKMRLPKYLLVITAALALSHATATLSDENIRSPKFSLYYVAGETKGSLETYIVDGEPPLVKDVRIEPASPGPGEAIRIEAVIDNDPVMTQSRAIQAEVHYSTDDGATWTEVDMERAGETESGPWQAEIPPLDGPGEIRYYFTAVDDAGNVLLELPAVPVDWGAAGELDLTASVTDKNDDSRIVADDLDIIGAKVGFDGELLYFALRVEGKILGGTVSPFAVNLYSVGIYYPELIDDGSVKTDMVLMHAQHAQFMRFPIIGLLNIDRDLAEIPPADTRYYADDGWLYMRFRADVLKGDAFGRLRVIFGTAYATAYQPEVVLRPVDTSMFINIVNSDRRIDVAK